MIFTEIILLNGFRQIENEAQKRQIYVFAPKNLFDLWVEFECSKPSGY
jgi:hypothetical protein